VAKDIAKIGGVTDTAIDAFNEEGAITLSSPDAAFLLSSRPCAAVPALLWNGPTLAVAVADPSVEFGAVLPQSPLTPSSAFGQHSP
jgi:hypothetical protein